ncbi:MAG: lantibiotic dehydratase family protein [Acidobacteriia bacterium]|nr:lantibiotic dehydratase family protein [Terriglobia bacterium]
MAHLALLRVAGLPFETLAALSAPAAAAAAERLHGAEAARLSEAAAVSDLLFVAAGEPGGDPARVRARFALLRLRRDVHNRRPLRPLDLEAARSLLAPDAALRVERLREISDRRDRLLASCREALREEVPRCRRALLRVIASPLVQHGIYLASRSLLPKVRKLSGGDPEAWGHDERHTAAKALAYAARFCTKTSPNGVFCAVALASIEGDSADIDGAPGISLTDVILNIAEARKVGACLASDPAVDLAVFPRPNPTLREVDGGFTFWKPASRRNATDEEIFSRAKDHPVLRLFVEEAARGIHDATALKRAVASRLGVAPGVLTEFYRALVDRGILIAEIEVAYNSRRPLRDLASAVRAAGCEPPWLEDVERVEAEVDALPGLDFPSRVEAMEAIGRRLDALPHARPLKADELFRVDASSDLSLRLPRRLLQDLDGPMGAFARLIGGMYPEDLHAQTLAARFLKEFPGDTDVPFLDLYRGLAAEPDESGRPVEFPMPKEEPTAKGRLKEAQDTLRRIRDWFVERARSAAPGEEVEIDAATVDRLAGAAPEPRWAAGVLFQVAARSARAIEEGHYRLVLSSLFNGTGLALARFAHFLGKGRPAEENPIVLEMRHGWSALGRHGAVLAEVTYNHEARTANAGLRPALFEHEIELPGDRASRGASAIPLGDLTVRYVSVSGRFVLRSASRGVEVIPVLSSGVNPVGIVSDLVHIGQQGWQSIGYLPGFRADSITRWPRFTFGRTVLFRERWVLRPTDFPPVGDEEFFIDAALWRRGLGLPRHIFVHTVFDPKPYYVDLESPLLTDLLRRTVAGLLGQEDAVLFATEMLPAPDEMWLEGEGGRHASEILVQMQGPGARAIDEGDIDAGVARPDALT